MTIRELPAEVIAQIAAGEVVTRPGDAVKELVENAIDAILARPREGRMAGSISIDIWDGGYTRLRVADDGCGIPPEELAVALLRHATSKITRVEDLERLGSLGFRGEALAAITAIADVAIVSAVEGAALGAAIEVASGWPTAVHPASRRAGTTLTVERIFERVPARRKFQRAPSAESAHIARLVQGLALAYPEIGFTLTSDDRPVLRTPGTGELRETVSAIFGLEVDREMLLLMDAREADDPHAGLVGIAGLVGSPDLHRATRAGIFLTANRRPIDSRQLVFAIEDAYATQIPVGRHPMAIIDITVPTEELDANVHPTKREVQLTRERLAFGVIQHAVRSTLSHAIGIPSVGSRPWDRAAGGGGFQRDSFFGGGAGREGGGHLFGPGAPREEGAEPNFALENERLRPQLGALRILGQVGLTYIICEGAAGLYLVDQHAAHERVLLERLEEGYRKQERVQLLLEPVGVTMPPSLRGALDEYVNALAGLGFEAAPLSENEIVVRSVPSALPPKGIERALQETLEALESEGPGADWRERLAILLSCKTAIKAGQHLEIAEMHALLQQLDEANLCATCSHGRPTAILLSHVQLEREFGRR